MRSHSTYIYQLQWLVESIVEEEEVVDVVLVTRNRKMIAILKKNSNDNLVRAFIDVSLRTNNSQYIVTNVFDTLFLLL